MTLPPIRVLIADDHPVVVSGLRRFFESCTHLEVVDHVVRGDLVEDALARTNPDVLVLDVNLPVLHGFAVLDQVAHRVAVVMYSMHDEAIHGPQALRNGARAFVSKTQDPQALVDAIQLAHLGGVLPAPTAHHPLAELSEREQEVFQLVVDGASTTQMAAKLGVSKSTVHTYVDRVKMKVGVDTIPQLVAHAFRQGWVAA